MARISVQHEDFEVGAEIGRLGEPGAGGVASYVGLVRSNDLRPISAMILEHYPAMTESAIARIAAEAETRFQLLACTVIHRFGRLVPGERIVFVGGAAAHRQEALDAVAFLMDWLKTKAPFWKQEVSIEGVASWVEATAGDDEAAARW